MRQRFIHTVHYARTRRVVSAVTVFVMLAGGIPLPAQGAHSRDSLAPKSAFTDTSQVREFQKAEKTLEARQARTRRAATPIFSSEELIAGTPLGDELRKINRGRAPLPIYAAGDAKSVTGQLEAALKGVSSQEIVFLSCRVRTLEEDAEQRGVPPHALVRHLVFIAKAKTVKENIDAILKGRVRSLSPYFALNIGEYKEDKNLHIYWLGLTEAFRGRGFMSSLFDNLTRVLQKKYGGYSYTSVIMSDAIEHLHESRGLLPVDTAAITDTEELEIVKRLLERVHEFEFVTDSSRIVFGRIPPYRVSIEESARQFLLEEQAQRYGLQVDIEDRTIAGKTIREWTKGFGFLVESISFEEIHLNYQAGERLHYYRYPAGLKEVEDFIVTYARSIGEEQKTQKWMEDLKASARRFGRSQKEYLTGLDGPHKLKKSMSPLEWAVRGEHERELAIAKQEKLFGVYPIEGARVEDLPLWPVDPAGRVIEELVAWMRTPGASPPPRYYLAEKATLSDIAPQQMTFDFDAGQIGKGPRVENIAGRKARVIDSKSNLHYLDLEPRGVIDTSALSRRLEKLANITEPHRKLLLAFLSLLEKSPPEQRPELCAFRDFVEDLYGFASANRKIIALHEYLSENPVALFHEIGEYLIDAGLIRLSLSGSSLVVSDQSGQRLGDLTLGPDARYQASKNRDDPHYLLRALQREIFGAHDRALTAKIKFIGNIEIESKRAGMDDVDALIKEIIVRTDDFEKIVTESVGRKLWLGDLSGRIKIVSYAEGSNKKVYQVTFYTRDENSDDPVLAWKKEKGIGRIPQSEVEDLRWLSTAKRKVMDLVPVYGFSFRAPDGKETYLENFINGSTVEDYRAGGALTWDLKKKIISNLFTIGIMLGNKYPKDVHERNFIITPEQKVVMIDIGNKRFSIPETLRHGDYRSMVEYVFLILMHYGQEGEDHFIKRAFFQSLKDVNEFLRQNKTQVLRVRKTIGEARTEIIRFMDGTRRFLMNLSDAEREKLVASLMDSVYMRGYFAQHGVPESERRLFVEKTFTRVMNLLRVEYQPSPEMVDPAFLRIGKLAAVTDVTGGIAQVQNRKGKILPVPLTRAGTLAVEEMRQQLALIALPHSAETISAVLSLLERSPPEKYTFDVLVDDLFGFVAGPRKIALHESIAAHPLAQFHEACESLVAANDMRLALEGEQLAVTIGSGSPKLIPLDGESLAVARKDPSNQHYLIRAFARAAFGESDRQMTKDIKAIQKIYEMLDKAVIGDSGSIRSLRDIAVGKETGGAAAQAALSGIQRVIETEDLGTIVYSECATAIRMLAYAHPSYIQPSTVQALEQIMQRDLGVYAHEEAAAALREIAHVRPELMQPATVATLVTMLKEKGFQTHNASASILHALTEIIRQRPEFIAREADLLPIVEGVFAVEGLRVDMYGIAVSFLRAVAEKTPDLITKREIENVEKVLAAKTLTIEGFREAALFLRAVNQKVPKYSQAAQKQIDNLLKKEGLSQQILKAIQMTYYNGSIAQMGKLGQVSEIGATGGTDIALVVKKSDPDEKLGALELVPQKNVLKKLESAFRALSRYAPRHDAVLKEFLNLLRTAPQLQKLRLMTFDPFIEDVFGFARPQHQMIGLYEPFIKDPLALFHEYAEYLIAAGLLDLKWDEGKMLQVSFREDPSGPVTVMTSVPVSDATRRFVEGERWEAGWRADDHYLLRVLQRQLFGDRDRHLTAKIKHLQEIEHFQALACDGDIDAINKLIYIAYNLSAERIIADKALAALEAVLMTDGLTEAPYAEAASGIRVAAMNRQQSVSPSSIRALERCMRRAEPAGFLLHEVNGALREIVYAYPEFVEESTVDALTKLLQRDNRRPDVCVEYASTARYIAQLRPELITPALYAALENDLRHKDPRVADNAGECLKAVAENAGQLREQLTDKHLLSFRWFKKGLPYVRTFYDEYLRASDPGTYLDNLIAENERYIDRGALENMINDFIVDADSTYSNLTVLAGRPYAAAIQNAIDTLNRELKLVCPQSVLQPADPAACHTTVAGAGRIVREFIPEEAFERVNDDIAPLIEGFESAEVLLKGELRLMPNGVIILQIQDPEMIAQIERIRNAVCSRNEFKDWYRPKIVHISLGRLKTAAFTSEQILRIRDVLNRWNQTGPFLQGLKTVIGRLQFGLFSPTGDKRYYASAIQLKPGIFHDQRVGPHRVVDMVFPVADIDLYMSMAEQWNNRVEIDWSDYWKSRLYDETGNQFQEMFFFDIWKEKISTPFDELNAPRPSRARVAYANFFNNDYFVAYKDGMVFHRHGEPLDARTYPSVVRWFSGDITAEQIRYRQVNNIWNVYCVKADGSEENITGKISLAFFGQPLIWNGTVTPTEKLVPYFSDLGHVFTFPKLPLADGTESFFGAGRAQLVKDTALAVKAATGPVTISVPLQDKPRDGVMREVIHAQIPAALNSQGYVLKPAARDVEEPGDFFYDAGKKELTIFYKPALYYHNLVGIRTKPDGAKEFITIVTTALDPDDKKNGFVLSELGNLLKERYDFDSVFVMANGGDTIMSVDEQLRVRSVKDRYVMPAALNILAGQAALPAQAAVPAAGVQIQTPPPGQTYMPSIENIDKEKKILDAAA